MAGSPRIRPGTRRKGAPVICPAPLDLQVNGGGGRMLGEAQAPGDVLEILAAHRRLGTGAILPTLISDTPEVTDRVIHLVATARKADAGILGLHLEGPHIARPGAHDPARLRDLTAADIAAHVDAKARLGHLLVTLAPERATPAQIAELAEAGVIVSLGHTDCSAAQAEGRLRRRRAHGHASLQCHVRPASPRARPRRRSPDQRSGLWADRGRPPRRRCRAPRGARRAPGGRDPGLPTPWPSPAPTPKASRLGTAACNRRDGRLTLDDGTLAGADLSLLDGLRHIARVTGQPLTAVLPWASTGRTAC